MRFLSKHYKRLRVTKLKTAFFVILLNIILVPVYEPYRSEGDNLFEVYLNDTLVGTVDKNVRFNI